MSLWSLAFQVANFLILAVVLQRFLFKPVTAMVARRQSELENVSGAAAAAKREADDSRKDLEQERQSLRAERERLLADVRVEAAREQEDMIEKGRSQAAAEQQAARDAIAQERLTTVAQVADEAIALAVDMATTMLRGLADAGVGDVLLERFCLHVEALPPDRRLALRDELATTGATIDVATAPPLAPDAQRRWGRRIADALDPGADVHFVHDAGLIAGAELRLPHTRIGFCWRDGLRAAREGLVCHADAR